MRIATHYSHQNGLEFLQVHHPELWAEVQQVIEGLDGEACRTKISKEKRILGQALYSPIDMNKAMRTSFSELGWKEQRTSYWVTDTASLIRKTLQMSPEQQKAEIEAAGRQAIFSYNQTDFVKQRVAVEVLFDQLHVKSAYRDSYGQIYADACKATNIVLSADHMTKITDARQVRR